ncbi:MAG: hypothetical protein EF813_03865, partial [Methanosarcinales archaeon]
MSEKKPVIVVAGDVTVDWFMYPVDTSDEGENWRLHTSSHADALPGGAALLTKFIRQSLEAEGIPAIVTGPPLQEPLRDIPPERVIHSNVMLDRFQVRGGEEKVLRISKSLGYIGSGSGSPQPMPPEHDFKAAEVIVLDDAGNGFRDHRDAWHSALPHIGDSIVVYKMRGALITGALWDEVSKNCPDNRIMVINASDLRRTSGVHISKSLSWERTAKDFVFQLHRLDELKELQQCPYLIVLFGTDGAILHRGGENANTTLIFDPSLLEGGFAARVDGRIMGLTSIFTATIVRHLAKDGIHGITAGIEQGLGYSRALLEAGYVKTDTGIKYPPEQILSKSSSNHVYTSCHVERPVDLKDSDPNFWRILHQKTRNTWQRVAEEIVIKGDKGLEGVPMSVFGELATIDRFEIESYSAIRELIIEFLANPEPKQPLCFAVFGPPGSGKSFGVKQILKDLDENEDKLKRIIFNISQFGNYQDLVAAFHDVRDIVLEGRVPFVFFDEFDSALDDQRLGWLKYFLAPMQDGEFRDGESTHPLGNAIFVFAGGTKSTYKNFVRNLPENNSSAVASKEGNDESQLPEEYVKEEDAKNAFRDAKVPDFVSRLRGHINVMGLNRQRKENDYDDVFIIRRAKILRTSLKNDPRASGLCNSKDELNIDEGVLRAMLHITKYKHGTRSMKALIEMSRLEGKKRYDLSALPVRDQLDLHVDADEFLFLTKMERYQSILRMQDLLNPEETSYLQKEEDMVMPVAKLIHKDYVEHRDADGTSSDTTVLFEDLPDYLKQSNRDAAEDIPNKLRAINHGIRKITPGKTARTPDITDDEVEKLSSMEHDRFCRERRLLGWVDGEKKDTDNKISPYLVSFDKLPDDIKAYNRESIYAIPVILKELDYEIYRMEEVEEIDDPHIIDRLARIAHDRYVKERSNEGDTPETNPSMVEFDALPNDMKEANLDYAKRIPVLLRGIDYGVRRLQKDAEPKLLTLDAKQIETMAEIEHARWNWQKILQGWIYKEGEKNIEKKTTPHLVPWKEL